MSDQATPPSTTTVAASAELEHALDLAAERDEKGRLRGHHVVTARNDIILVRPGTLQLGASVERGVYVEGLKPGQRLATPADLANRREQVNETRRKQKKPAL